ncbi:MAG: hypothetical protein ABI554_14830 [Flavobacterium sp.]
MNKTYLLILAISFFQIVESQNLKINAVLADKATKTVLSSVNIFNEIDSSISNSEGAFSFISTKNEINFSNIGYNSIQTTFDLLKGKDTIFMESKAITLDEVVINNVEPFIKKILDNLSNNYSATSYTNDFFLRSVIKKNDEIVKFQDFSGIMSGLSINKNSEKEKSNKESNKGIEILNMRKISIQERKEIADFKLPSFDEIITTPIFLDTKYIDITEENSNDENYRKIIFISKNKNIDGQKLSGYLIVNKKDYAITQYFVSFYDEPENAPYKKTFLGSHKYRTTKYEKTLKFSKNSITGKYYINNQKLDAQLEFLTDKKIEKTFHYDLVIDYFVTKSFTNETVNSNFAADKDVFKAKFTYSEDFWKTQNQLPLTSELQLFINKATQNKENKKEFEVIGNF